MNQSKCRGFFLVVLFLASGCVKVGPDFEKPRAALMPNWLEAAGYKQVSTSAADYRDWWLGFKDPVLEKLIQTAYRQNLPLQIAGVRVLGARAQLGVAVGELYPQSQKGTGSLQKERLSETSPLSGPGSPDNFWLSQMGFTASWEFDFWGKFRRAVESADASLMAALSDYDNILVSLTAEVANAYIQLRTLEKRLQIARQNVEVQKQSLVIATARWKGGTTSKRDVEQAQTVLDSTEATIPSLESRLRQTQNALCVLMGMPPHDLRELVEATAVIPAPPPQVAVGIPADLLRRRPDIQTAEWRAAAQCAQIGVAKANLYPAFSLSGTFGFQASDAGNFLLGDMFLWKSRAGTIGPSFQWNILNYGQITNQVRYQDARLQELLIAYENTVLQAQQEVENALIAFLKNQERAQKLAGAVAAAQSSVELAVIQYREGITDFTTVLTAEQALLAQQDSLAQTLGDISINLVGVYRALGGGWQLREGQELLPAAVQEAMRQRTNWGKLLTPAALTLPGPGQPRYDVRPPDW
jgi:NodT family efflux transporter outer membrane factor (OMF) lipoprotein